MRPVHLLVVGWFVMWFITSGRAAKLWTVLTDQPLGAVTPAPAAQVY